VQKDIVLDGYCKHKAIWPVAWMDIVGTLVLILIMTLATMGGIGGGGVVVFLIKYLLFFSLKEAVALSNFSIFTCSVMRYFLTADKRHPEKKTVVALDYGLATVMMPTVLMGSFIGVWFNIMLPDIAIQIILALLLFFLTFQAALTGRKLFVKENKALQAEAKKKTADAETGPVVTRMGSDIKAGKGGRQASVVSSHYRHVFKDKDSVVKGGKTETFPAKPQPTQESRINQAP
jgi:uncharacterized membrane protein YfcA